MKFEWKALQDGSGILETIDGRFRITVESSGECGSNVITFATARSLHAALGQALGGELEANTEGISTMKLAYIAGPFRATNAWQRAQNIREAEHVGMAVAVDLGVQPVIPHSNTGNFDGTLDDAFWLAGTKEMMRRCDLVVCTHRWIRSQEAQAEVEEALRLAMPVYIHVEGHYHPHVRGKSLPRLTPAELRAIVDADWKREIACEPITDSISQAMAGCSSSVPQITRYAVQHVSQPEPPPTGNGDLVTPSLLEALADYPALADLCVRSRCLWPLQV